jgi:hypothetical protein
MPNKLRKRFLRQRENIRGLLKVTDGTDGGYTVSRMEHEWEELARDGFIADVIVIDYDDELVCEKQYKGESARRFEFAEIYRRLRLLAKKTNTLIWTAAQTGKQAEGRRVITGKDVAEDYSKIRKVFFCLTVGTVAEEENVKFLYVAKNRIDRGHFGVEIVSDFGSALFYDREATLKRQVVERAKAALG